MASDEELRAMGIKSDNVIICENCYEENEASRNTCKNCGSKLYKNNSSKNEEQKNSYNERYNTNISYTENNKMAKILRVVAIIEIVCGFIVGAILGDTFEIGYDYNWGLCIGIIVAGVINGIFILGFAEIIQLLQDIKSKTKK
mgnify:CR=1 FL=1